MNNNNQLHKKTCNYVVVVILSSYSSLAINLNIELTVLILRCEELTLLETERYRGYNGSKAGKTK